MRLLEVAFLSVMLLCASCEQSSWGRNGSSTMTNVNIVAGPGERTFTEKYGLTIGLPMSEKSFLEILDRLQLRYETYGRPGSNEEIPPSHWSNELDLSKIQGCYQIYGDVDRVHRVGEIYRAYVDMDRRVVYIENAFSYTGP